MVNILIHVTAKQIKENKWKPLKFKEDRQKVPLIVFGSGMFGKNTLKLKGLRAGVTGVFNIYCYNSRCWP
ncbi:hypothetical protein INT48_003561, partial [Thamnidium elegans]